jgi:hypothetical protein
VGATTLAARLLDFRRDAITMGSDEPIQILSEAGWPVVACPGCSHVMRPTDKRPIAPSFSMVMVRYYCESCQFETFRTAKDD